MSASPSMMDLLKEHIHLVRTLRVVEIHFDAERCGGVWQCYEVCPVGCWRPDRERRVAIFEHGERCIACGACLLQCPEKAIELRLPDD